jgi:SOS response regulatory protein OraA/RecX
MTNRITPYEAGWLTLLVRQGICSEDEARAAFNRVAQAAIDHLEARRAAKRELRRRLNKRKPKDE